jgi:hypothetical protein
MHSKCTQSNSTMKAVLALVLSVSLVATGCTAQWISVALADLPVLTQMALNIASLAVTLQSGRQLNPVDAAAIQNISAEAGQDLNLLQSLYDEYETHPNVTTLQKINSVIRMTTNNLPTLLAAAHISDPVLAARVTAGGNLILTTVESFAALVPQTGPSASQTIAGQRVAVPQAKDLKKRWNEQVCAPTGDAALDSAFAACALR